MSENSTFDKLNPFKRFKKTNQEESAAVERTKNINEKLPEINDLLDKLGKLRNPPSDTKSSQREKLKVEFQTLKNDVLNPLVTSLGLIINEGRDEYPGEAVLYSYHQGYGEIKPGTGDWEFRNEYVELVKPIIGDRMPNHDGVVHVYQTGEVRPIQGKTYTLPDRS